MNPAQDHFTQGLVLTFDGKFVDAAKELQTAIDMGLSHDDEMQARFFLGEDYLQLSRNFPADQMMTSKEFLESIQQMEKAVAMDREGGYAYFADPVNRARLRSLDIGYTLAAHSIREKEGLDAAVAYFEKKLQICDHLSTTPLLTLLLDLGCLYIEKKEKERARLAFKRILEAEAVDPADETGQEAELRSMARGNLEKLDAPQPTKSGCFVATAVYGHEDFPEVKALRRFRDEHLLTNHVGRMLVNLYYRISPALAERVRRSQIAKHLVREAVIRPLLFFLK